MIFSNVSEPGKYHFYHLEFGGTLDFFTLRGGEGEQKDFTDPTEKKLKIKNINLY